MKILNSFIQLALSISMLIYVLNKNYEVATFFAVMFIMFKTFQNKF